MVLPRSLTDQDSVYVQAINTLDIIVNEFLQLGPHENETNSSQVVDFFVSYGDLMKRRKAGIRDVQKLIIGMAQFEKIRQQNTTRRPHRRTCAGKTVLLQGLIQLREIMQPCMSRALSLDTPTITMPPPTLAIVPMDTPAVAKHISSSSSLSDSPSSESDSDEPDTEVPAPRSARRTQYNQTAARSNNRGANRGGVFWQDRGAANRGGVFRQERRPPAGAAGAAPDGLSAGTTSGPRQLPDLNDPAPPPPGWD